MSYTTKEQIMMALFKLLSSSSSYETASRRLQLWGDVGSADKPALFLVEKEENHQRGTDITPAVRTINADVYIYTDAGKDQSITPITVLNNLIDAIDPNAGGVLAPNPLTGTQTLGGLVWDCYIDGKIMKDAGDLDGDGIAIIPLKIVIP